MVLKYFFSSINCFYETLYVFDAVWLWRVQIVKTISEDDNGGLWLLFNKYVLLNF